MTDNNDADDAWENCNECPCCNETFTSTAKSRRLPLVSTCGHTICCQCFTNYRNAGKRDEQGEEKPPHMWTKKAKCLLNCGITAIKKIHDGQTQQIVKSITDAFVFDTPITNDAFMRALGHLIPLRNMEATLEATNNRKNRKKLLRRLKDIENIRVDPFHKCDTCHTKYSAQARAADDDTMEDNRGQQLHPHAPMIGTCGHTVCLSCVYNRHAEEIQVRQSGNLKRFPCPRCKESQAFHVDRLWRNQHFMNIMVYWEAAKEKEERRQLQKRRMKNAGVSPQANKSPNNNRIKAEDSPRIKAEDGSDPSSSAPSCYKFINPNRDGKGSTTMMAIKVEDGTVDDGTDGGGDSEKEDDDEQQPVEETSYWHLIRRVKQEQQEEVGVEVDTSPTVDTNAQKSGDVDDNDNDDDSVVEILDDTDDDESTESDVQFIDTPHQGSNANSDNKPTANPPATVSAASPTPGIERRAGRPSTTGEGDLDSAMKDFWYKTGNQGMVTQQLDGDMDDYWSKQKKNKINKKENTKEVNENSISDAAGDKPAAGDENDNEVIELLTDSDDDDDDEDSSKVVSSTERPVKRLKVKRPSRRVLEGDDAVAFLQEVPKHEIYEKLQFLCYDEFQQLREWHITKVDDDHNKCIMPDKAVMNMFSQSGYIHMLKYSTLENFAELQYTPTPGLDNMDEWVVSTNVLKDRSLESDYVYDAFRPEFLAVVEANPSKRHSIEPWCRMFPPKVFLSNTAHPSYDILSSFRIKFPLTKPREDCKLIFAFASAISFMKGIAEEAEALHQSGAMYPSDNKQIERLEYFLAAHLPSYKFEHSWNDYRIKDLGAYVDPIIIKPKLSRGSHFTCFLVIFENKIFEPSFDRALWLNKKNLDLCCGSHAASGEFNGVRESWRLVRSTKL